MNTTITQAITQWLQSPDVPPDGSMVGSMLQSWPWFVPARMMEAAIEHDRVPFSPRVCSLIHLYSPDWASAYYLIAHTQDRLHYTATIVEHATLSQEPEQTVVDDATIIPKENLEAVAEATLDTERGSFIQPLYTEDYFRHQGISAEATEEKPPGITPEPAEPEDPKSLMVVMSFAEWLNHFKTKTEREQEEEREKSALRSMWQQEKLAAALEDEPEEIPEDVFKMAVSSITREGDLASESLAEILEKQEKWGAAAEMYRKLGLRNPAKSAYFASRAEAAKKRLL